MKYTCYIISVTLNVLTETRVIVGYPPSRAVLVLHKGGLVHYLRSITYTYNTTIYYILRVDISNNSYPTNLNIDYALPGLRNNECKIKLNTMHVINNSLMIIYVRCTVYLNVLCVPRVPRIPVYR